MLGTEFTSICPRTGQPDFGSVVIEYVPRARCLESRALKYYLASYREEGAFCEALAARIADDVVYAIKPRLVKVRVNQNVRGGIAIVAPETVTYKHLKSGGAFVTLPGQDRLKVDYLSVTPLPPGETECAGIV